MISAGWQEQKSEQIMCKVGNERTTPYGISPWAFEVRQTTGHGLRAGWRTEDKRGNLKKKMNGTTQYYPGDGNHELNS